MFVTSILVWKTKVLSNGDSPMRMLLARVLLVVIVISCYVVGPSYVQQTVANDVPTIYGTGTGTADATIETVTFARDHEDLVTTFRVKGTISSSYSYQIGVVFYEKFDGDYSYKIFTYRQEEPGIYSYGRIITKHSALYDKARNTTEQIASIFKGDTWTASIPLSLIGYRTHFWVWVGIFDQLKKDWADFYPPAAPQNNFEVSLPARLTLRVQPTWLANEIRLSFDGIDHTLPASGELLIETQSGPTHTISVTPMIQTPEDVRYVVEGWSDDQYAKETRSISLDSDTTVTVTYSMETIATTNVESQTTRSISASSTVSSSVTTSTSPPQVSLPDEIETFIKTAGRVVFPLAIIIVVGVGVAYVFLQFRKRPEVKHAEIAFCISCGKSLPPGSKFCNECGTKQSREVGNVQ